MFHVNHIIFILVHDIMVGSKPDDQQFALLLCGGGGGSYLGFSIAMPSPGALVHLFVLEWVQQGLIIGDLNLLV